MAEPIGSEIALEEDGIVRRFVRHPLVPVVWSVGVAVGYALFPSSDTHAVIAESVWVVGVLLWLAADNWASSRFYNGSGKGIAGQSVSQTGNFSEGHE